MEAIPRFKQIERRTFQLGKVLPCDCPMMFQGMRRKPRRSSSKIRCTESNVDRSYFLPFPEPRTGTPLLHYSSSSGFSKFSCRTFSTSLQCRSYVPNTAVTVSVLQHAASSTGTHGTQAGATAAGSAYRFKSWVRCHAALA